MRIIIKGGIWKNTEDEILKAAVSKYGKNQWARISSLLVRKSPKQCKARWYEWLDPSIKKTEWSKEEDEKLLHLAKLMPTQWRTIAPIVGRTPSQCLERYQKLLDEAEAKEGADLGLTGPVGDAGPSADDVRRLRPGEIDPDPETKPARPDPVDMDEDEKEMLSEARARLANTQGKKAKRKAREKQLEEARRLASLQKRRELKAAGIDLKVKKKKKGMDYNADIPFEKKPAPGFYDISEEKNRQLEQGLSNVHLHKLDGKRRSDANDEKKGKKQKTNKNETEGGQINFIPAKTSQLNKLKQAEQISKRRKLVLPAPQVGENELEEIVKIGFAGENIKAVVGETDNISSLGDYTPSTGLPLRTPRTPSGSMQTPRTPATILSLRTPRTPASASAATIKQLRAGLSNLPAPKNDFEIVLPDVEIQEDKRDDMKGIEEDASDRDKKIKAQLEEEEQAQLLRRSQAIQRDLPRPTQINAKLFIEAASSENSSSDFLEIERLINTEMVRLLNHDAIMHPIHGSKIIGGNVDESFEEFSDDLMNKARKAIDEELDINNLTIPEIDRFHDDIWQQLYKNVEIVHLQKQLEINRNIMVKDTTKAAKLEKKLNVTLAGYLTRSRALSKKITEIFDEIEQAKIELNSFQSLNISEKNAIPKRIEAIQDEVDYLSKHESELQQRYSQLSIEKQDLQERINILLKEKENNQELKMNKNE
ncbi:pre-mRNA splicing factor component-domain-containing protein [Glomus cerebriforme]|uniref:Pre-mRNA splicing factor component-domain-containing protein n=1 Tax=Glomus cerebriforme TaxID=658196 RepID=A0A397SRK1_9GLOM|nr:pre-mRNA splicing factor component-domain-containing protein [Glomus cerebriforme]